jgi:8-oxo-dGTP pyrophosphatase MutT (NUDIX family)
MFHLERPENFSSEKAGSICFLECNGEFLLLKRSLGSHQRGTWTAAPGGKVEPGETPLEAAGRELREETGIELPPERLRFLHTAYLQFPDVEYMLHLFYTSIPKKPPVVLIPREHTEYAWATLEKALQMPLMRGGKECIDLLTKLIAKH